MPSAPSADRSRQLGTGAADVPAYADPGYVASLADVGRPVHLPGSGGWLLSRSVPDTDRRDLSGPYPLFSCADWSLLADDLATPDDDPLSVVAVADPLGSWRPADLQAAFPDHLVLFKRHQVRELSRPAPLPSHHRRQLGRAARAVEVEVCADPLDHLDDWVALYDFLVARRRLTGISAFSRDSFSKQLAVPRMLAVRAERDGATVGMALWLVGGDTAYYHLGASTAAGYEASASYAIFAAAFEHLRELGVDRVDLGGSAGAAHRDDGLFRFKSGWANAELPAWLGGRVVDRPGYEALAGDGAPGWFPAYRAPAAPAEVPPPSVEDEVG
ncbi:GNAT family N-acetyltransferase [Modestobacter versicolor]|uniref:GNAT family N-acetyltransferase n=1 Tax=Modestobacter versicolor TaxID=429133 RepID=UPI0034DF4309